MVKKILTVLTCTLLYACGPHPGAAPSFRVAGTYKFTQYSTVSKSDLAPIGQITITMVDDQHVDLKAEGTSHKSKITYTYQNVSVTTIDHNYLGEDTYGLTYKNKQIGVISTDEQGHYISLTPKPDVTLMAEQPVEDN